MKSKGSKLKKGIVPYLFISPWITGLMVFTLGPLVFSFVMSFFDWPAIGEPAFVGLDNYVKMFTDDKQFYASLTITFKYAMIFVPLNLIIALFLAMLISQPLKGVKIFRTIYYVPAVVSSVATAILWSWILNSDYGVLNYLLSLIGIEGPKWLVDPSWAILAVVLTSAFGVGTMMLIFYTNIKSIPGDIYEAAAIDGAGAFRQFFSVTLPIITPTLLFNTITSVISAFQQLALVMLLTGGGPMKSTYFYGLFTYNNAFVHNKFGYASANAWFMFVVTLCMTGIVFKSSSLWVFYESGKEEKRKEKK